MAVPEQQVVTDLLIEIRLFLAIMSARLNENKTTVVLVVIVACLVQKIRQMDEEISLQGQRINDMERLNHDVRVNLEWMRIIQTQHQTDIGKANKRDKEVNDLTMELKLQGQKLNDKEKSMDDMKMKIDLFLNQHQDQKMMLANISFKHELNQAGLNQIQNQLEWLKMVYEKDMKAQEYRDKRVDYIDKNVHNVDTRLTIQEREKEREKSGFIKSIIDTVDAGINSFTGKRRRLA